MALPKQVRDQINTAAEIEEQIKGGEGNLPWEESDTPELTVVPDEPVSELEPEGGDPVSTQDDPDAGEPEAVAPDSPPKEVDYKAELEKSQHKFDVLNGKYTKEVPRLARQVRDQNSEIERLQSVVTTTATAPDEIKTDEAVQPLLTDEEREEYGTEFLDIVGRAAKENVSPEVATLKKQIDSLTNQLGQITGKVAAQEQSVIDSQLDSLVPNWRDLNTNQDFITWLNQLDMRSGFTLYELMNKAYQRGDADVTASFFRDFLTENGTSPELIQPELGCAG